jgi:hypothetical protein
MVLGSAQKQLRPFSHNILSKASLCFGSETWGMRNYTRGFLGVLEVITDKLQNKRKEGRNCKVQTQMTTGDDEQTK